MPSNAAETALRDIRHHIDLAIAFIADAEPDELGHDLRTLYAVVRCLEIISEASRRKQIAGAGNIYRHDYEDVAAGIIWNTVVLALPVLRNAIDEEIARLP